MVMALHRWSIRVTYISKNYRSSDTFNRSGSPILRGRQRAVLILKWKIDAYRSKNETLFYTGGTLSAKPLSAKKTT